MFYHCFCNICETITIEHFYKLITENILIIEVLLYIYNVRTYKAIFKSMSITLYQ